MRRALLILPLLLIGCGSARPVSAEVVVAGVVVAPEPVRLPAPGTIELRAGSWYLELVDRPGANPRDICVATGLAEQHPGEGNTTCAVSAGRIVSFAATYGSATVIAGVARPGVRSVKLGGTPLPLSAHRAFLAVVKGKARLQLVVDGRRVRTLRVPLPPSRAAHHANRRRGAVFNDEIGESVTLLSYARLVDRFGPPAVVRTEQGLRCTYYELVGNPRDGWRFCFASDGSMHGASGNTPPPRP